jgi:hypothetical protein
LTSKNGKTAGRGARRDADEKEIKMEEKEKEEEEGKREDKGIEIE